MTPAASEALPVVTYRACQRGSDFARGRRSIAHYLDLRQLRLNNLIGKLADTRIANMSSPAGEDCDRMVWNHRLHVGDIEDGLLATDEP
jgi:hypothetical protein